ncbi:MAG: SCO family protein, partial [Bacillota bacterium]|nr:SCO family protein [Bacillota bacterium]
MKMILSMFFVIGSLLLAGCSQNDIKNQVKWPVKDFTFTNQDGKQFGSSDLKGKVWVADFVYTSCKDVCPPMTFNLSTLQKKVKEKGIQNVKFVSFSIDPTVDTTEKIKKYAGEFNADFKSWTFLTGYSQDKIENFALKNFKALVKKP